MPQVPPIHKVDYNQSIWGIYGEFGSAAATQVAYLQSAIPPADLAKTTLISDITGSEAWPVPDLFQREVDVRRVTTGLLPYIQDKQKVKFFNPITLTVLPFTNKGEVLSALPAITAFHEMRDDAEWIVHEMKGFYRFSHVSAHPTWVSSNGTTITSS